ncbi:MAG: autotransporter-associated beta strand repeat-containing protein, partial [bacterium]
LIGGGSTTSGSTQISILPWAIGQNGVSTGVGNTFVTYSTVGGFGNGFRALDTATEYEQLANSGGVTLTNNVRYSSAAGGLVLLGSGHQVNSLLLENTAAAPFSVSGSNFGDSLVVNSGAFLTLGAQSITVDGFDGGISLGAGVTEYHFHTLNTGVDGTTIVSDLTSTASLTKSGVGVLVLSGVNTAVTGQITLNQGLIRINDLDNIGGDAGGAIVFRGGGLQIGAGFFDDFSTRTLQFENGGLASTTLAGYAGILPISGNLIDTNGNNAVINAALTGSGGMTKTGAGTLTLSSNVANTLGGPVTVVQGTLELANTPGIDAIGAGGLIVSTNANIASIATLVRLMASDQIADNATVTVAGAGGTSTSTIFSLNNFTETIGKLIVTTTSSNAGVVQTGATGVLTVLGDIVLANNRDAIADDAQDVVISGTGTTGTRAFNGFLDLSGTVHNIIVTSNVSLANMGAVNGAGFGTNKPDAIIETVIQNGGINKLGGRVLFLTNANTYAGTTTITEGAIRITNALGLGSAAAGTLVRDHASLQVEGNFTVANEALILNGVGSGGFGALDGIAGRTFWNGSVSLASDVNIGAETGATLLIGGQISGAGRLTKVGPGALVLVNPANNWTGGLTISQGTLGVANSLAPLNGNSIILANGASFGLYWDGSSLANSGARESWLFDTSTNPVTFTGSGGMVVDRVGATFSPLNKTLQINNVILAPLGATITVANNNGYGLEWTQNILNLASAGGETTFSVATASISNVVQGFTISSQVTGGVTGAGNIVLTKAGAGTMVLGNSGNTFGGGGSIIDITAGILSVGSDGALGDAGNDIRLSANSGTQGLRVTGSFDTSRVITLNAATTGIEVVGGSNTLRLNSAFATSAPANALQKSGGGILAINAANTGWNGVITITNGAVRVENAAALGSTVGNTVVSNSLGSAVQFDANGGSLSIGESFSINNVGINSGGALQSVGTGTVDLTGPITMATAATIGADLNSTLRLSGRVFGTNLALTLSGAGTIQINTSDVLVTGDAFSTVNTLTVSSTAGLFVGQFISGTGIAPNTTISAINGN